MIVDRTIKVLPVTNGGKVDPLHVQAARLQAVPQRGRADAACILRTVRLCNTVALLQDERVQNVLGSLLVALQWKSEVSTALVLNRRPHNLLEG